MKSSSSPSLYCDHYLPTCAQPCLVGGIPTPLKNMTSSVGMMTFQYDGKNNPNVPNHQPDIYIYTCMSLYVCMYNM